MHKVRLIQHDAEEEEGVLQELKQGVNLVFWHQACGALSDSSPE